MEDTTLLFEIVTDDNTVIGTTAFEGSDPPMGVVFGRLVPTTEYAVIRDLVVAAQDAGLSGPHLRARSCGHNYLEPCEQVYITDFADEIGEDEQEVTILGLGLKPYAEYFAHHQRHYRARLEAAEPAPKAKP